MVQIKKDDLNASKVGHCYRIMVLFGLGNKELAKTDFEKKFIFSPVA